MSGKKEIPLQSHKAATLVFQVSSKYHTPFLIHILLGSCIKQSVIKLYIAKGHSYQTDDSEEYQILHKTRSKVKQFHFMNIFTFNRKMKTTTVQILTSRSSYRDKAVKA